VERELETRLGAFLESAERVRRGGDEEAIHDLRVAARRLGVGLRLWWAMLRPRARRRAFRRLQRLRRRLGPIRELEVHAARLPGLAGRLPAEAVVACEALQSDLDRRLGRARRRAVKALAPARLRRIRESARGSWRALTARIARHPDAVADAAERTAAHRRAALSAVAHAVERRDDVALHAARIQIKKWRYALECMHSRHERGELVSALRGIQEALGEVHDRVMLRAYVERRARRLQRRGFLGHAEALRPLIERLESERGDEVERALAWMERLPASAGEAEGVSDSGSP
jgi:CHAD domain-containing protein